jgi:hypothetical protein
VQDLHIPPRPAPLEFPVAFLHTQAENKKLTGHKYFLVGMTPGTHAVGQHLPLSQIAVVPWSRDNAPFQICDLPRPLSAGHSFHIKACNSTYVVGVDNKRMQELEKDVQPPVDFGSDADNLRSYFDIFAATLPAVEAELSEAAHALDESQTAAYMQAAGSTSAFVPILPPDVHRFDSTAFTDIAWHQCALLGPAAPLADDTTRMRHVRVALAHHRMVMLAIARNASASFAGFTAAAVPVLPRSVFVMKSSEDGAAIIVGVIHLHFTSIQCKTAQLKTLLRPHIPSLTELVEVSIAPIRRALLAICPVDACAILHADVCVPFQALLRPLLHSLLAESDPHVRNVCWSPMKLLRFMAALDLEPEDTRAAVALADGSKPMVMPTNTFLCACGAGPLQFPAGQLFATNSAATAADA